MVRKLCHLNFIFTHTVNEINPSNIYTLFKLFHLTMLSIPNVLQC